MRVTWVHPSWRDLVIDHLAQSPDRRRAFLHAAGLPGLELALSTAGGPTGARRLPLVTTDQDWDALGDTAHRMCLSLAQDDLARLLGAFETAIVDADRRERAELEALGEMALTTVRRRLDQESVRIDPTLLERWQGLAGQLAEQPPRPDVGPTLAVLDPTGADPTDAASVDRLDDYLAILEATGEPPPNDILEELTAFLRAAEVCSDLTAATRAALQRLGRVHRELAPRIWRLLDEVAARNAPTRTAEPTPTTNAGTDRVRRILADL
jgi:hypothetical protein